MVTLQTADNALKSFYLDAVKDALNTKTNPLLSMVQSSTANVVGKDVKKLVRIGINGGISAGSETGDLPKAGLNEYKVFRSTLKNLYGTIEISDKAIRAAANNDGAFVNLLNEEMQGLLKSSSANFGRMLYGNGSGKIDKVVGLIGNSITVENPQLFVEGMVISICAPGGEEYSMAKNRKIVEVDLDLKQIKVDGSALSSDIIVDDSEIILSGCLDSEITGLDAIFNASRLYDNDRDCRIMKPHFYLKAGSINENMIHQMIDQVEDASGCKTDLILCSKGVRRALLKYYNEKNIVPQTMEIPGGYTAINFNGVPIVTDRFCPKGVMYLLHTDSFKLHQLCDWQWLEGEDGKILKQVPGKPVYTATLVKYAELMCDNPAAQAAITGITEA